MKASKKIMTFWEKTGSFQCAILGTALEIAGLQA